jgi:hypothetical protein
MKTDTAEEVLDRWVTWDYELDKVADKIFFLKAMEEHASLRSEQDRKEIERLKRALKRISQMHSDSGSKVIALEALKEQAK